MGDVSRGEGRTVLFVSHNMGAVKNLCNKAILLNQGNILAVGNTNEIVGEYLKSSSDRGAKGKRWQNRGGNKKVEFLDVGLYDRQNNEKFEFFMGDDIFIKIKLKFNEKTAHADIGINIKNNFDELFTHIANFDDEFKIIGGVGEIITYMIHIKDIYFTPGTYHLDIAVVSGADCYDQIESLLDFKLLGSEKIKRGTFHSHIKIFTPSKWKQI